MNYAFGCAFNTHNILYNFPLHKYLWKHDGKTVKYEVRYSIMMQMFLHTFKMVLEDIIERNVTFNLPTVGIIKCNMHMTPITGDILARFRQAGAYADVDLFKSNFTAYRIAFCMYRHNMRRTKTVYVTEKYKRRITELTNQGKQYGESINDTYIKDYYDRIYELFPEVPKKYVRHILKFAWKSLYLHNSFGGDFVASNSILHVYIGKLPQYGLAILQYYIHRLKVKIRVMRYKKKAPYDGYYYFALSDRQYEDYLRQLHTKRKKRKFFTFTNIMLYKIFDECNIMFYGSAHIFRIKQIVPTKLMIFKRKLVTSEAELFVERPPLKFKDIMVSAHKYDYI